ncbi:hypothetical protein IWW50_006121, partial [Coemansia erecta]
PWSAATQLADELWWIEPRDAALARQRLVLRHIDSGLARTEADAVLRITTNDSLNGDYSLVNRAHPTRTILN